MGMADRPVYSFYYEFKQHIKRLIPPWLFRALVNYFHFLESIAAVAIYGWPARGMHIVGVTGTNGKTTTAAFIASILEEAGFKVGLSTTALFKVGGREWDNDLNMTVTDQFAVQKLLRRMRRAGVDWVVLEVTSHALRQHRLLGIPFRAAVWTNLTREHLDYHGTMERYAAAKAKLLRRARDVVVLNADDDWYEYFAKWGRAERTTYGIDSTADVRLLKATLSARSSKLKIRFGDVETETTINLPGKFNAYNALAAAACAFKLGVLPDMVADGLARLPAVPGRMEAIDEGQSYSVVVDFAHTADELEEVLDTLRPLTKNRLIVVFGATGPAGRIDRTGMGQLASLKADVMIVTNDEPKTESPRAIRREILDGVEKHSQAKVKEIPSRRAAIKKALMTAGSGDTVAVLGLGHQRYRRIGDRRVKWDDREVVRQQIADIQARLTQQ